MKITLRDVWREANIHQRVSETFTPPSHTPGRGFAKPRVRTGSAAISTTIVLFLLITSLWTPYRALGFSSRYSPDGKKDSFTENHPEQNDSEVTSLKPHETVIREIQGGESETFVANIGSGNFVHFHVEQFGAPLLAELFDPVGQPIITMDTPAGGSGPIYFSAITTLDGNYQVRIRSKDKWSNPAKFELTLAELRVPNADDKQLIAGQALIAKGRERYRATDGKAALQYYAQAIPFFETTKDYHWLALTHYALAEQLRIQLQSKTAIEHLENTLSVLAKQMRANDWRLKASALNDLGSLLRDSGQIEPAQIRLDEALSIFTKHEDRRGQASTLNNLARVQFDLGNLSSARQLIEQAVPLRVAENDLGGVANLWNALGAIADRDGDPQLARTYFIKAVDQWNQITELAPADRARIAAAFNNLAKASDSLADWDQALKYYDKALEVFPEGHPSRAATLDNKGELLAALGDLPAARKYYDEALKLLISDGAPDTKAGVLIHVGQLLLRQDMIDEALGEFRKALLLQDLVSARRKAEMHSNLGSIWAQKKEFARALDSYSQALAAQEALDDRRGQASTHKSIAKSFALMDKETDALKELNTSLALWRSVKDESAEAATLKEIALLKRDQGKLLEALQANDKAILLVESLRTRVSNPELRTTYFENQQKHYELAIDLRIQMSRRDQSQAYVEAAFEKSENARARVLFETLTDVLGICRDLEKTAVITQASSEQCGALEKKLLLKRRARTRVLNEPHTVHQVEALDREIVEIAKALQSLDASMVSQNPHIKSLLQPQPFTSREIQQHLDDNTLMLEYALGERRSYLWAVTPTSINVFELPSRDQVEPIARRVTEALTARNRVVKNERFPERQLRIERAEKEQSEASAALSDMVLAPVASLLGQKRLVIVADGALQLVPFSALPTPGNSASASSQPEVNSGIVVPSSPLIAHHEIITLPSASVLALHRRELANRKPAPLAVAVLADPVFDQKDERVAGAEDNGNAHRRVAVRNQPGEATGQSSQNVSAAAVAPKESPLATALRDVNLNPNQPMSRLTHSRREATAITRTVSPDQSLSALDFKANRETATSSELSKYRIVHFATHGLLDLEHPELSGIVLSMVDENGQPQDGYLRLHEIYNLNLPAELVVLSACQTGIGRQFKGEGLIALTRGFMYAGAKSVVASLWKVDDAATSALMAEFYRQMFTNKHKPAAALREAQLTISKQRRWQSPYYWAGFFLQGEWN